MEKLLEVINDYNKLKCNLELLLFAPLDECQKKFLKTFDDFDIDIKKMKDVSNNSDTLSAEIVKFKEIINMISKKYNTYSLKNFENKIVELWDIHHFFDIGLLSVILRWLDDDNSLGKIYVDMVKENLIINPNIAIGVSSEPIFTLLPKHEKYIEYNLKLLSEPIIDWNLLKNGTPVLETLVYHYNNAENEIMKKYYHDVIMVGIKSSMCLFNNIYYHSRNSWKTKRDIGLCYLSLYPISSSCVSVLEDFEFIEEIKEYLLSEEGLEHQVSLYRDVNEDGDKAIIGLRNLMKEKHNNKQKKLTNNAINFK